MTTEAQLKFSYTGHFHSCNHQKWLPYPILGGKTLNNVQIEPQTTEIARHI